MNKYINRVLCRILPSVMTIFSLFFVCAQAQGITSDPRDTLIIEASEAYAKKNAAKISEILPQVSGHPMEPWVDYWSMRLGIEKATPEEMRAFFQRWKGTYVEDRLRNDWLLVLGKKDQLDIFAQEYPAFVMRDDSQVLCYALLIDHRNKHDATAKAKEEFLKIRPPYVREDGCNTLAATLYKERKMSAQDIWIKARRLVALNRVNSTQRTVAIVQGSSDATIKNLMEKPGKWLENKKKETKSSGSAAKGKSSSSKVAATQDANPQDDASKLSASEKELITLALIRWAAKEPDAAIAHMNSTWKKDLTAEQISWVYGMAGYTTALRREDKSVTYYNQSTHAKDLSDEIRVWHARAQLRAAAAKQTAPQGWKQLIKVIDQLPPELSADPAWVYWRAIAIKLSADAGSAQAAREQANTLFESIAGVNGFYQQLATEALGRPLQLPPLPQAPTQEEINKVNAKPGFDRAIYAVNLGLRSEGTREWNWSLRGLSEREIIAAAQKACNAQIWDRCINTSERAKNIFNVEQRYPLPYRDLVTPRAVEVGLDPAFVFGLMRQESRFNPDIKSSAGATGLMQLMPKTAQWTAKKIGMTNFQSSMVTDPKTNIDLGTAYLYMSVEEFGGSELLAAAGYNAGPSRPRRWRNGPVLDGAVWSENVPFDETRNYVQTVLPAAVVYHMILSGKPQSLQSRMGQIGPDSTKAKSKNPDLP